MHLGLGTVTHSFLTRRSGYRASGVGVHTAKKSIDGHSEGTRSKGIHAAKKHCDIASVR